MKTLFFSAFGWGQVQRELDRLSREELSRLIEMAERKLQSKK
jgi:hypothetical protein